MTMPKYRFHKLADKSKAGEVEQPKAADAGKAKPAEAEQPKATLRTVATITPPRRTYARAIRISGLTEADKRAVLATRVAGVIDKLPVKQGQRVKTGDLVLMLAAEEKLSAVSNAKQLLVQRQAELDAALRL
ncbi:MAG: biotin/lipoyl-binding protein, partial [Mesorhizobium sp.]